MTNNDTRQRDNLSRYNVHVDPLTEPIPRSEVQAVWGFLVIWLAAISVAGLLHLAWHWWAG